MHVLITTPRWQSLKVHWSIAVKYIEKRVVAMTHPCFTPIFHREDPRFVSIIPLCRHGHSNEWSDCGNRISQAASIASLTIKSFGKVNEDHRQWWVLFPALIFFFFLLVAVCTPHAEYYILKLSGSNHHVYQPESTLQVMSSVFMWLRRFPESCRVPC